MEHIQYIAHTSDDQMYTQIGTHQNGSEPGLNQKCAGSQLDRKGYSPRLHAQEDHQMQHLEFDDSGSNITLSQSIATLIERPPPPLPEKSIGLKKIRFQLLTTYKRLFSTIFVLNLVFLIVVVARRASVKAILNAAATNLVVSSLAREELFINASYIICCSVPRSAPLWIRRNAAKVFHYGGLHSGCGVAAVVWFLVFVGKATHVFATSNDDDTVSLASLIMSYCLLAILLAIVIAAHPTIRVKQHDLFEHIHRLLAWTALILFLVLLLVSSKGLRQGSSDTLGKFLVGFPTFWFSIIAIFCALSPWMFLEKVTVLPERLSNHAILLHFNYTKYLGAVVGIKVATKLHGDWHSFAAFPDKGGLTFSALVSNAGDWTKACIQNEPTQLWKRGYPIHIMQYVGKLFRSIVAVATGSGIGPIISLLGSKGCPPCRVLWQTKAVKATYGEDILARVFEADPNAIIVETDRVGRKDMLTLVWNLVKESGAEAAVIVSNPNVTRQVVFGLEARGVPAFGPIFDS